MRRRQHTSQVPIDVHSLVKKGEPGSKLYFATVQECAEGVNRWIEIPAEGRSADDYEEPAPELTLTPGT